MTCSSVRVFECSSVRVFECSSKGSVRVWVGPVIELTTVHEVIQCEKDRHIIDTKNKAECV